MQIFDEGVEMGYWQQGKHRRAGAAKLRRMLLNKMYCGKPCGKYNTEYPKIVDEETIDAFEKEMKTRKFLPKAHQDNIYYSKGLLRDEITETALLGDRNHVRYTATHANKVYGVNINVADSIVWHCAIQQKYISLSNQKGNQKEEITKNAEDISKKILNLQQKINDIDKQMDRNYNAYIKGRIKEDVYEDNDDLFNAEKKRIQNRQNELEKKIVELSALMDEVEKQEEIDVDVYQFMNAIQDDEERKKIIDEMITKYTVRHIRPKEYIFKVWNKYSEKPDVFVYISSTSKHKKLYEVFDYNVEFMVDYTDTAEDEVRQGNFIECEDIIEERFKKMY